MKAKGFVKGEPPIRGEDYEWVVMQLTPALVNALAKLGKDDVAKIAPVIAKIEELEWSTKDTARVLDALIDRAKKAEGKQLYSWTST